MAKSTTTYICNECGTSFTKWLGQCPECQQWNSITEQRISEKLPGLQSGYAGVRSEVHSLSEVQLETVPRLTTGMLEFDRVLGGGVVQGSVVLVGGDPGIGKSTLLLQAACLMSQQFPILYVSGEESLQQIAIRAKRLKLPDRQLKMLAETQVENICVTAEQEKPSLIIIDSIQTMQIADLQAAPGSVSQVRETAARLTQYAKQTGVAIFLVGHVTKTGDLAGPRVLEHIIDVVCYIESSRDNRFRIARAVKNRFGAINELGVFAMTDKGMKEVKNPSAIFLSRQQQTMPGSAVMVVWEGSRPLLVEIQALVDDSYADYPKRITMGLEQSRLIMLLAVLHKHGKIGSYDKDVFINIVGGIKVLETSADLAMLMAIVSSLKSSPLPLDLIVFGEVGLAGEVRPVPNGQERLREAAKHGFKHAIIPRANAPQKKGEMKISAINTLAEALAFFRDK